MRRRDLFAFVAGAMAWPLAAHAQKLTRLYRIFWASTDSQPDPFLDGFREGLRKRGYREGHNVVLELRYAGNPDALGRAISELAHGNFDLAVSDRKSTRLNSSH